MKKELIGVYTIWLRDIKRYFRDKPRIIGSFAQPILFLFVLGTGIASSLTFGGGGGEGYLNFMFPGIVGMTVLFTSFFSAMSIVWDREFGFLREVLVTPISRTSIVAGKLLGGSTIAMIQGTIILLFSPLLKIPITFVIFFKVIGIMFLVAMTIATLGIVLASVIKSMQAFQVITNFLLMPMFFLSGALFPLNNTVKWMNVVSKINPLSYGIDAMRTVILNNPALQLYPLWLDIVVLASVTVVMSILGAVLFSRQD
ncbi:MAG: ABC transporter permease [Candidatus Hydromicrobium sp.]|nr:ABC transporter permease [Candidatus Hydromicrobium sp.]